MSRIGKLTVKIPENVTVVQSGQTVNVTGPKGELTTEIEPKMSLKVENGEVFIVRKIEDEDSAKYWGLTRTLLANMVAGVTEGFKKELEINGIGYRASVSGDTLTLHLGYSHPILYQIPEGIKINVEKNIILVSGIDKQKVGQVAAEIRKFRKPEPYKGKGIRYADEVVRRKSGKTAATAK